MYKKGYVFRRILSFALLFSLLIGNVKVSFAQDLDEQSIIFSDSFIDSEDVVETEDEIEPEDEIDTEKVDVSDDAETDDEIESEAEAEQENSDESEEQSGFKEKIPALQHISLVAYFDGNLKPGHEITFVATPEPSEYYSASDVIITSNDDSIISLSPSISYENGYTGTIKAPGVMTVTASLGNYSVKKAIVIPHVPSDIEYEISKDHVIRLSWNAAPGITKYEFYEYDKATENSELIDAVEINEPGPRYIDITKYQGKKSFGQVSILVKYYYRLGNKLYTQNIGQDNGDDNTDKAINRSSSISNEPKEEVTENVNEQLLTQSQDIENNKSEDKTEDTAIESIEEPEEASSAAEDDSIQIYNDREEVKEDDSPREEEAKEEILTAEPENEVEEIELIKADDGVAKPVYTYTVKFDKNAKDATGSMDDMTLTSDEEESLTPNSFARKDYTFAGWKLDPNSDESIYSNGEYVTNLTDEANSTVTLYAHWKLVEYSINYNLGNHVLSNNDNPETFTKDDAVNFVAPEVATGYIFDGWFKDSNYKSKVTNIKKGTTSDFELYAKCSPIKYTIVFDKNAKDAGGSTANLAMEYDIEKALNLNKFTRKGYTFAGWKTSPESDEIAYEDSATVINLASESNQKVTLYAEWTPIDYKITYYLGGSKNSENNSPTYTINDQVVFDNPTPDSDMLGYEFDGWYKDANYRTKITEIKKGSIGDIAVYAKWATASFKLSYDAGVSGIENAKATGNMPYDNLKYGISKALRANSFRRVDTIEVDGKKKNQNYVFVGWSVKNNTEYDSDDKYFADKQVIDSNDILEALYDEGLVTDAAGFENNEVTLYAVWRKDYTITFNSEGGEPVDDIEYSYGTVVKLPNTTREGYAFAGWYADETYKTKVNAVTANTGRDYTLYAKWNPNKYSVLFNKNAKDASGSLGNLTITYDVETPLRKNTFVRKGYKFTGWNTDDDGSGESFIDEQTVRNMSPNNNAKITLYAQWEETDFEISFVTNGGRSVDPIRYPYSASQTFEFDESTEKSRYIFTGWYYDEACKKIVKNNIIPKGTSGDLTLYAGWKLDPDETTYYLDYFDGDKELYFGSDHAIYEYNKSAVTQLPIPEDKDGYTFVGWYKDSALKSKLGTTIPKNTKGDFNLYAKWNPKQYKITFNANATDELKPTGRMGVQTLTFGTAKELTKNSFALKGYKFTGWSETPDGDVKFSNLEKVTGDEFGDGSYAQAITLYAVWELEEYTITYVDPAGASNPNTTTTYTINDTVDLVDLHQFGNTFQGWYTNKSFGTKTTGISKGTTGDKTFYAKWYVNQRVSGIHIHKYDEHNTCTKCGRVK